MPVTKYRAIQEMTAQKPLPPLQAANLEVLFDLVGVTWGFRPWKREAGVRKFRSIEQANQAKTEWERTQVRARKSHGDQQP